MYFLSLAVTIRCTSASIRVFSASAVVDVPVDVVVGGGMYHFDNRVFPCRFCNKKNRIYLFLKLSPTTTIEVNEGGGEGGSIYDNDKI